jgi:ABC-2 type transport system ATP-binding protein
MTKMASVRLADVCVSFPIYDSRSRSLKRRAMSVVTRGRVRSDPRGRISTDASHRVSVHALDHVNLEIEHGTRLGLVGRNGAGKSTLLHVIAGIYAPAHGKVTVAGRIASLLGGSLGIDPELTGRENLELRGLYLGLSRAQIHARLEQVIDFTELGPFIDMPLRTYSAGMRARLDFAISTSIEAEILLLDEGLGVGDASFIEKANRRLDDLAASAGIVVFASHSEPLLRKLCTRAVLMEGGHVLAVGDLDEVLERYRASIAA